LLLSGILFFRSCKVTTFFKEKLTQRRRGAKTERKSLFPSAPLRFCASALKIVKTSCLKAFLGTIMFLATGCSTTVQGQAQYLSTYQKGDFPLTQKSLEKVVAKEMPKGRYTESRHAVWLLLDRGTVHFAGGNAKQAVEDYKKAIEALDYYRKELVSEKAGQFLLQDDVAAYIGSDFERLLAQLYFSRLDHLRQQW